MLLVYVLSSVEQSESSSDISSAAVQVIYVENVSE